MRRGDLYRVRRPGGDDPRKSRVFLVVSREALIESGFASVICAPVDSHYDGLATQVEVGPESGLKHPSSVYCDALVSLPKTSLTDYIGALGTERTEALNRALRVALDVE